MYLIPSPIYNDYDHDNDIIYMYIYHPYANVFWWSVHATASIPATLSHEKMSSSPGQKGINLAVLFAPDDRFTGIHGAQSMD